MRIHLAIVVVLAMACKGDDTNSDDTGQPNDLPNPLAGLEATDECDNLEVSGCPFGAASSYLAGDYTFGNDGAVTGFEYWLWIPNDTLAGQSADWDVDTPCTIVWEVFADKEDDPDCSACLFQINGSANFQATESDCAQGLEDVEGQDNDFAYNVRAGSAEGEIRMFFTSSDNEFASGFTNDLGLVWTSEPHCELVGASDCR
ncbi:MAG: hypothetical protein JRJ84_11890 [Deltaproteobacteria bacterium]|nr:hypothetical protein [Deltaproteobacteria bacterium]